MARRYIDATACGDGAQLGVAGTGTEQIGIPFDCDDNVRRVWFGYFSEKAEERTVEAMKLCGWRGDWNDLASMCERVNLTVDDEEYQGQAREKVQFVNAIGRGGVGMKDQMDDTARRAFAARMRGTVVAVFGGAPAPRAAARPAAPAARPVTAATRPASRPAMAPKPWPPNAPTTDEPPPVDDDLPF